MEVVQVDETGAERLISTLGSSEAFGVGGFHRNTPRSATTRAATDVLVFSLERASFEALFGAPLQAAS